MQIENPIVIGVIDEANYRRIVTEFSALDKALPEQAPITLVFNSPGGDTYAGIGLYDMFGASRRHIVGIVLGHADSVAIVVLQACNRRLISPSSTLDLVGTTVSIGRSSIEHATSQLEQFRWLEERCATIIADRSGQADKSHILRAMKNSVRYDACRAAEVGLVDEVIVAN